MDSRRDLGAGLAVPHHRGPLEAVQQKLKGFRVSGMAQALLARLDQARAEGCDYLELLERLLDDEMDKRRGTLVERRFKASKMPARHADDTIFRAKLKKAQRAWIAYRDLELDLINTDGNIASMCLANRSTELSKERTKYLKYLANAEEGDVCAP